MRSSHVRNDRLRSACLSWQDTTRGWDNLVPRLEWRGCSGVDNLEEKEYEMCPVDHEERVVHYVLP